MKLDGPMITGFVDGEVVSMWELIHNKEMTVGYQCYLNLPLYNINAMCKCYML